MGDLGVLIIGALAKNTSYPAPAPALDLGRIEPPERGMTWQPPARMIGSDRALAP